MSLRVWFESNGVHLRGGNWVLVVSDGSNEVTVRVESGDHRGDVDARRVAERIAEVLG